MVPESPETPVPTKHHKTEEESTIAAQLSMCIKDNQELHKKMDAFNPSKIAEVIMQAVAGGYQNSFQKPNTYQKSTNPFVPSQQKQVKIQIHLANHISGHLGNLKLLPVQMVV